MIPDYFTSYTHQLEQIEAYLDEKLAALTTFTDAVRYDWEATRKKKARMRLDDIKKWVEDYVKGRQNDMEKSEFIKSLVPNELQRLLTDIWTNKDAGDAPPRLKEMMDAIMLQPENVAGLLAALEKIRMEIETTTLPSDKTATVYVYEKFYQALSEAYRRAVTLKRIGTRIFSKGT